MKPAGVSNASTFNSRTALTLLFVLLVLLLNLLIILDISPTDAPDLLSQQKGLRDERPLVAVLVQASSTAYTPPYNAASFTLYSTMLPSLVESLNCDYRYIVVVGYEAGDGYFDSPQGESELTRLFGSIVLSPSKQRFMDIDLITVKVGGTGEQENDADKSVNHSMRIFKNIYMWARGIVDDTRLMFGLERLPCTYPPAVEHQQVSVVTAMARRAYAIGADYLYRVNDDTIFYGRWAHPFASILTRAGKPYGVIGACSFRRVDSNNLLQHHFVHRTHLELFDMHMYPPDLEEMWRDLWISRVYGRQRTFITRYIGTVTMRPAKHRHAVSNSAGYIASWVNSSRLVVHNWIETHYRRNSTAVNIMKGLYSDAGKYVMHVIGWRREHYNLPLECSSSHSGMLSPRFRWCLTTRNQNDIKYATDVDKKASRLSTVDRVNWRMNNCSNLVLDPTMKKNSISFQGSDGGKVSKPSRKLNFNLRPPLVNCTNSGPAASPLPLIAVMSATTSRHVKDPSNATLSLMKTMLPSLIFSLDCGFQYVVVLGFDDTDNFFNSTRGNSMMTHWFDQNVRSIMEKRGMNVKLKLVCVQNKVMKPGPVFLEMARVAHAMGADYMYRVNDDTEFIERWPRVFVEALMSLPPPYGVIGPRSFNTDNRILTHDFVHRTHMEVFHGLYYPTELQDWWMDDWISSVYGQRRSFMSKNITIYHHTKAHGKRYKVDFDHEKLLQPLTMQGRNLIAAWMRRQKVPAHQLQEFILDTQNQSSSQDIKLKYYSTGNVVENYYEIKCKKSGNTFCPPSPPLTPAKTDTKIRVPDPPER